MSDSLNHELTRWLDAHAQALDAGEPLASGSLLGRLGTAGLLRLGVPTSMGGAGGAPTDVVETIAAIARHSLTAAFVLWAQRAFIEFLAHSPNEALRETRMPMLLAGRRAGATGLSNAMKALGGLEAMKLQATGDGPWRLSGSVPWATNIPAAGFDVAVVATTSAGRPPLVLALPAERAGLHRSADLDLLGLRGSHTAALTLDGVDVDASDVIHPVAPQFLPRMRPVFLAMQCGLSMGLAQAALAEATVRQGSAAAVLAAELDQANTSLNRHRAALLQGLEEGVFLDRPAELFRLRIALAQDVQQALQLELSASGGRAYQGDSGLGFARRWREAAFIPIVTPSLIQLQGELARLAPCAANA